MVLTDEIRKENERRAVGRIRVGIDRMLGKYAFHAGVLNRMDLTLDRSVGTMAVGFSRPTTSEESEDTRVLLMYNPEFVLSIPVAELVGVLLHETHHVLFDHLTMSRKDYPHRPALIIAQEVSVNEFIREPLPKGVILLKDYPNLPAMEDTVTRYKRLEKLIPLIKVVLTLDDHGKWDVNREDGQPMTDDQKSDALDQIIGGALDDCDPDDVPPEAEEAAKQRGITPGSGRERIRKGKSKVSWQQVLRRYTGQILEVRPVYNRPPRRFPDLLGIVPTRGRQGTKPKILAAIDTSGSMTPSLLSQVSGELCHMTRDYEVLAVECDTDVRREYPLSRGKGLDTVWGRGGTDLQPPLQEAFLRQRKVDLVIYFTDGYGPAPEKAPCVPVIWAILPGGTVPTRYGKVVQIPKG